MWVKQRVRQAEEAWEGRVQPGPGAAAPQLGHPAPRSVFASSFPHTRARAGSSPSLLCVHLSSRLTSPGSGTNLELPLLLGFRRHPQGPLVDLELTIELSVL